MYTSETTSPSLSSSILAHNLIGWQESMEGCLAKKWRAHASTFLTKKQGPRPQTVTLIRKLWLVAFDMWEQRCNELHKNDLSNKVQELDNISTSIWSLLCINSIELLLHQRRLFSITPAEIFYQTPKIRRE